MKVSELSGIQLDYWVARAEGNLLDPSAKPEEAIVEHYGWGGEVEGRSPLSSWAPSTEWDTGGPIIEREKISVQYVKLTPLTTVIAASLECRPELSKILSKSVKGVGWYEGESILIAAMRAYVASKFGDEVKD